MSADTDLVHLQVTCSEARSRHRKFARWKRWRNWMATACSMATLACFCQIANSPKAHAGRTPFKGYSLWTLSINAPFWCINSSIQQILSIPDTVNVQTLVSRQFGFKQVQTKFWRHNDPSHSFSTWLSWLVLCGKSNVLLPKCHFAQSSCS